MTQRWGRSRDSSFLSRYACLRGTFRSQQAENEGLRQPADVARTRAAFEAGHRRTNRIEAVEHTTLGFLRARLRVDHNTAHSAGDTGA